jgi:putative membrane protein
MKRRYQKGDAGAAMLVMMVVVMLGALFWHDRGGHMQEAPGVERTEKTAQELLDEAYARGQITREEYLRKRADLAPAPR